MKNYIEFFTNPSRKETESASKYPMKGYLRFTADFYKKEIIVWNAIMLHNDAHRIIINKCLIDIDNTVLAGQAEKVNGKWIMVGATSFKNKKPQDFLWANKYIKIVKEDPIQFAIT